LCLALPGKPIDDAFRLREFQHGAERLAVTAPLVCPALQTHQSVKHTRAQIEQARTVVATSLALAERDLATAWLKANGGPATPEAGFQTSQICGARLRASRTRFTSAAKVWSAKNASRALPRDSSSSRQRATAGTRGRPGSPAARRRSPPAWTG